MITLESLLAIVVLIWTSIYTLSYGIWNWKKQNRLGAVVICIIAAAVLVLPMYTIFFRY